MENLNLLVRVMLLLFTSGMLVSCGGGSGSSGPPVQSNEISAIQGTWRSNSCMPDGDNLVTDEIVINATEFTQSVITHYESVDCDSTITVPVHLDGMLSFSSEYTGDARHVDINLISASMTASEQAISALEAQGMTLQDSVAANGITDINNIPISKFVPASQIYTIYSLEGDTLRFGIETPSFTGIEPALRHDTLDTVTYSRVVSNTVVSDELSGEGDLDPDGSSNVGSSVLPGQNDSQISGDNTTAIAGVWDESSIEGGLLDVRYLVINADGTFANVDYLGDGLGENEHCYHYFRGRVTTSDTDGYVFDSPGSGATTITPIAGGGAIINTDSSANLYYLRVINGELAFMDDNNSPPYKFLPPVPGGLDLSIPECPPESG